MQEKSTSVESNKNFSILDTILRNGKEGAPLVEVIARHFEELATFYHTGFKARGRFGLRNGDKRSSDAAKENAEKGLTEPAQELIQKTLYSLFGPQLEAFAKKEQTPELQEAASKSLQALARLVSTSFILIDQENDFYRQTMVNIFKDMEQPQRFFRYFSNGIEESNVEYLKWVEDNANKFSLSIARDLARASKEVPLWEQTQKPYDGVGKEEGVKTLSRFEFDAPKKSGNELGFIAKKKTSSDDETKKKYQYRWMVKKNDIDPTEKISADIHRWFLGDKAPKTRLVTSNDGTEVLIASRFIDSFQTIANATAPLVKKEKSKAERVKLLNTAYEYTFRELPSMYEVIAVALAAGNTDFHLENIGQTIPDPSAPEKKEAAIVDFGRSLAFNADARLNPIEFPGVKELHGSLTPTDILRGVHKGHYHLNSDYFLNEAFAHALDTVVRRIEKNPENLAHAIHSSAREVLAAYRKFPHPEYLEGDIIDHAGFGITMDNLGEKVADIMINERPAMLRDLSAQIRIQVALKEQDAEKLSSLLREHPEFTTKEVKWLTMDDSDTLPKPSSLEAFAQSLNCSKEIYTAIEQAARMAEMEKIRQTHHEGEKEKPLVTEDAEPAAPAKKKFSATARRQYSEEAPALSKKTQAREGGFAENVTKERKPENKRDTHSL